MIAAIIGAQFGKRDLHHSRVQSGPNDNDLKRIEEIQVLISAMNRKGRHVTNVVKPLS